MNLQNSLTALNIWLVHHNLAVKTAWTQQGRVQNIRTIGSRNNDNALVGSEAIHLNQHLVKGLLTLIVATAKARTTLTAYGINLINKYDTR